ncbi:MAG: hypothetical protein Q7R63_02360 [bacterium]|nr:hypothetical protein [bacterium]
MDRIFRDLGIDHATQELWMEEKNRDEFIAVMQIIKDGPKANRGYTATEARKHPICNDSH